MQQLRLEHISKSFPGVKALDDINIEVKPGEVHALCGENGAGKSTLMNILSGDLRPDEGTIIINGEPVSFDNPKEAFEKSIATVHQHLSLIDNLSVAENIFANQHPVNRLGLIHYRKMYQQTADVLSELKINIAPTMLVSALSPAQKQMVEIAKALARKPQLLILDEPTASLTDKEIKVLFHIIRYLKQQDVSILYISHRLSEIFELADRVSILKDGKYEGTFQKAALTTQQLIKRMVGRDLIDLKPSSAKQSTILLEVKNLSGEKFKNINFKLHRGEIVGLAGLVGAGRTELARAIFGADKVERGEIKVNNEVLLSSHPAKAIEKGIAYLTEDRTHLGLFLQMSVQDNIVSANLKSARKGNFYSHAKAKELAEESKTKLRIATPSVGTKAQNLSGGNQQKVVLAKWLQTHPEILIVDEPTHGIDVGAKFEIYGLLKELATSGKGILMISSDLPELLGICDRILVLNKGTVSGELLHADATEEKIMALASH